VFKVLSIKIGLVYDFAIRQFPFKLEVVN